MAQITLTLSDDDDNGGVRFGMTVSRKGETEKLAEYPATPAMLSGLVIKGAFENGALDQYYEPLVKRMMSTWGMSKDTQEEAMRRAGVIFVDKG